jgi:hypothetical protein
MLSQLTFKKAFGLKVIPSDYALWFLELGPVECNFSIDNSKFIVKVGRFGVTEQEQLIIARFFHADERIPQYIDQVITLDIACEVDITLPINLPDDSPQSATIDSIVAPFISNAFKAATRLTDAYRTVKYTIKRGTEDWETRRLLLIPDITDTEFRTFLFYQLQGPRTTYVGCFSEGRMTTSSSTDNALITQQMQHVVQGEIPLNYKLIVKAWEYLFQEDYRNAVIYAATVLELTIIKTLRKSLLPKDVASASQIDTFLENTSNRLLCTVMLGLISVGSKDLREKIASTFDIRNGLVHGKRKTVSRVEAEAVLNDTEALLEQLERSI